MTIKLPTHLPKHPSKQRETTIKLPTHPHPLRTLTRKQKRDLPHTPRNTPNNTLGFLAPSKNVKTSRQTPQRPRKDNRAMRQLRAIKRKRPSHTPKPKPRVSNQMPPQPLSLPT